MKSGTGTTFINGGSRNGIFPVSLGGPTLGHLLRSLSNQLGRQLASTRTTRISSHLTNLRQARHRQLKSQLPTPSIPLLFGRLCQHSLISISLGARGGVLDWYTASTLQGNGQCTHHIPAWYTASMFRIFQANFSAVSQPRTQPVHSQCTQSCDCDVPIR